MRALLVGNVALLDLLFDLGHVDVGDGFGAVEDAADFLESWALCLWVHEEDPDEFDTDPELG
jgi:hypothetical protein